ncbi:amidohydrolase family protein [Gemmatimonas sp.]|uniref:amidohydrolase family protein n=1 Tax=Gemmatimonas sp. TaxID=1962908 RepID=UPI0025BBAD88|nr:amidohydrolase family protein [Gemmatimonas sp.]MCA2994978.1 amidohydrolase family protein [Gemmatimonas sp.]
MLHRLPSPAASQRGRRLLMRVITAAGVALAHALPAQPAPNVTAFTGATLIDGTGRSPVPNATLLVREGKVLAAGAGGSITVPAGATRVPLDGTVIIPGLINGHGHASTVANLATYAAYGVTTVYSLGDEGPEVFGARDAQRRAPPAHARVYLAGPVLAPATPDEARAQVRAAVARGVDIIKIRVDDNLGTAPKMPPEVYRAVIAEAHARGQRVAVHLYYLDDARALLAAGADYLAHSVRDQPVDAAFVESLRRSGVCYSPTLMREVSTFVYDTVPAFFADSQFRAHANRAWMATVTDSARMAATRRSVSAQRYKAQLPVAMRNLATLVAAGVPIAMGTDTGPVGRFQGFFEWMEMEMMVDAGLTPAAVLTSATRDAARCLRIDHEVGTLEAGKQADFVVLHASPIEDIRNIRRQHSVWIGGARVNTAPR